jgi:tetratricopeptide (TPR) repeat protein
MKIKLSVIGIFVIGLFSNAVVAGKTSERLFINAQAVFERSLAGDDSVTGVALNQFRILSMTYRDNPLFLAYQGACYTLMGRDAFWSWNKTGYANKGLNIIGKALRMLKPVHDFEKMRGVPISVETRLVAVSTFSEISKSFNHFEKAKAVLNDLFQSSAFNDSPVPLQARIYRRAAKIALKENKRDEEIKHLRKILEIDPKSEFAKMARKRLRKLK